MMTTFTLILFLTSNYGGFRTETIEGFLTIEDCQAAGTKAAKVAGGFDKAKFHCKEVRDDRK